MAKKKNDKEIIVPEGHTLKTRRDFLAHGFISAISTVMMPGALSFISQRAHGADCSINEAIQGKMPVFILDLAGGANIPGSNVIVGGAGGQEDYLQTYSSLGLPNSMNPRGNAGMVNSELGLKFHADSPMLRGILSRTSATTRASVDGGVFCSASENDTQNNPLNPLYWLHKAGATGSLANLAGTSDSDSGGRSIVPASSLNPQEKPVIITKPEDALTLINIGRMEEMLSTSQAQRVLLAIERMSKNKLDRFNSLSLSDQIKNLVECGYIKSQDVLNKYTPDAINANLDTDVTQVFGALNDSTSRRAGTMAKLLLDGYLGVATVSSGGYDYHNGTRATGETKDFDAGEIIGNVLELAARKQKNIMIYVLTDGGVVSKEEEDNSTEGRGKFNWTGDSKTRSSAFMLVYRQGEKPQLRSGSRQIGSFNEGGAVNTSASLVSNSSINLSKAIVANYLALHGEEGNLASIVGDEPFGQNLENYLLLDKVQ